MRKRMEKILLPGVCMGLAGLGYGLFYSKTGIGIGCPFYQMTGWQCPGCGATRMCVALMQGNVAEAMQYNGALFFMMPFLTAIFADYLIGYVRTGKWRMRAWENKVLYVMGGLFVIYGVARNLFKIMKL